MIKLLKVVKLELSNEFMSSNSYLLIKENKCIVIDPGFDDNKLFNYLENNKLSVDKIVLTHGHYDHWSGLEHLRKTYPDVPLYASLKDEYWYLNNPFTKYNPTIDYDLNEMDEIDFLGTSAAILKTPGHSLCSVSFYFENKLISGDVLFYEGIGRSDLYGGSFTELERSVLKLYKLPNDTIVYSGHGRPTTIYHEKNNNPFIRRKKASN